MEVSAKDTKTAKILLLCGERPEWCGSRHFSAGADCFISRVAINHSGVAAAIRSVRPANTAIVAKQCRRQVTRVSKIISEDPHSVTNIRFDVEQVAGRAAPVSRMKRHHLHQTPCAGATRRPWLQVGILREKDTVTAETANTPAKRLYLCVQTMYLKNDVMRYREPYLGFLKELRDAIPGARDLIEATDKYVAGGSLYKALKEIRKLMKREEEMAAV